MKKLMITAAIVFAAAMSQAAVVNWQTSAIKDHLGVNAKSATSAITAVCTIWNAAGTEVLYTSDAISFNSMSQYKSSWDGSAVNTSYQAQLVLTSADGWTLTSDKASFTTTEANPYSIQFSTGVGFTDASDKLHNTGTNFGWQSVPEPTSGLLLLLGVAGLALKRKRA